MSMSLNDTPRAMRLHIGLFGRRNSGKSSLINALTGQHVATVSDVPGTTTDPVYKSMEIHGIGPVVFIDTAASERCASSAREMQRRRRTSPSCCFQPVRMMEQERQGMKMPFAGSSS